MAYSAARLTLYAVLSGIEEDLRRVIALHLANQESPEALLGDAVWDKVTGRISRDGAVLDDPPSLDQTLVYTDFGELIQTLNGHRQHLPEQIAGHIKQATPDLERLTPIRNRIAHTRPLAVEDFPTVLGIAEDLVKTAPATWAGLGSTLHRLSVEPSFVLGLEIRPLDPDPAVARHNLPVPDFDETGFVGRKRQAADLIKLCLGPYPVISVLAEGGVGKTALVLKVAYDILDRPDAPFDAIVWSSAKTAHLTPHQINTIEGSIRTSLGMLESAARELGGVDSSNPLGEILQYLEEFRILLILDNLETVLDDQLRIFLEQLRGDSKVVITSRIGLGAFEYPIKLSPLEAGEAVELLRALAAIRSAPQLVKMPNDRLADYCARMHNNPGFIKWFVSAVQVGRRPEEILAKPGLFLDFCLSNVYNFLSALARQLLDVMVAIAATVSQAELAFVSGFEVTPLQETLQELLTTNMVTMTSVERGSSFFESYYRLSDFARAYLLKHHPVDAEEAERLRRRARQLTAAGEALEARQPRDVFNLNCISIQTRAQRAVARYLVEALQAVRRRDFESADALLEEALSLAPGYAEVYRVRALLRTMQGNFFEAREDYEAAIELEPTSAPLRKHYAGFLARHENDFAAALSQLNAAERFEPQAPQIQLEIARIRLWSHEWDESRKVIDSMMNRGDLDVSLMRMLINLSLQWHQRRADELVLEHRYGDAVTELDQLRTAFESASPAGLIDSYMPQTLARALPTIGRVTNSRLDSDTEEKAREVGRWLATEALTYGATQASQAADGRVVRVVSDRRFGFIRATGGQELFFHRADLRVPDEWPEVAQVGKWVNFQTARGEKGLRAVDVACA